MDVAQRAGESFDLDSTQKWTEENAWIPLASCALYLLMVASVRPCQKPLVGTTVVFAWNALLALFSVVSGSFVMQSSWNAWNAVGVYGIVCSDLEEFNQGISGLCIFLFVLSKIVELGDTAILLLRGRKLIFLHWYHHATVLLYTWHAYATRTGVGMLFASVNYGVHAIMYTYYAISQTRYKRYVSSISHNITFLQIAQMIVGISLVAVPLLDDRCGADRTNIKLALVMYFSYFILFVRFYVKSYCQKVRVASTKDD